MFSLLNTDCMADLLNFILIPSYFIKADKGLEYTNIYKHQNMATLKDKLQVSNICQKMMNPFEFLPSAFPCLHKLSLNIVSQFKRVENKKVNWFLREYTSVSVTLGNSLCLR